MSMKMHPMIQVEDVEASSRWYQATIGLVSGHGGNEYEILFAGQPFESPMLLQLHGWAAHEHGFLGGPGEAVGNGCSLWFETPNKASFDTAVARAIAAEATVLERPTWNPVAHHHEIALRDPDGYVFVINSPFE